MYKSVIIECGFRKLVDKTKGWTRFITLVYRSTKVEISWWHLERNLCSLKEKPHGFMLFQHVNGFQHISFNKTMLCCRFLLKSLLKHWRSWSSVMGVRTLWQARTAATCLQAPSISPMLILCTGDIMPRRTRWLVSLYVQI